MTEEGGDIDLLEPSEASVKFRAFCRKEVREKTTDQMRLFTVNTFGRGYELDLGGRTISVTEAEYAELQKGTALPENHLLTKGLRAVGSDQALVMYTHPLMLRTGPLQTKADDFAFVLAKAYPGIRIYRDPYSSKTPTMVAGLQRFTVAGPRDLYAVIADDSFGVQDYKIIQNIKTDLETAGVTVFNLTQGAQPVWGQGKGKGLIVITGHIDANLARFVVALGERGYFDGNYVVFSSCRSPLPRTLVSQINSTYKAAATFSFDSKIKVASVEDFLLEFTSKLQTGSTSDFDGVLRHSVQGVHLNGIWTVCSNRTRAGTTGSAALFAVAGGTSERSRNPNM